MVVANHEDSQEEHVQKVVQDWEILQKQSDSDLFRMKKIDGVGHMDFCASVLFNEQRRPSGLKAFQTTAQEITHFMKSAHK